MPGPLQFLEERDRDGIREWLRLALSGKTPVPFALPDQPVHAAIWEGERELTDKGRTDLADGAVVLLAEFLEKKPGKYLPQLLHLITALDLRAKAIPILRQLVDQIPDLGKRLGWSNCQEVLFALLELRDLRDLAFWMDTWSHHPRHLAAVTLTALFDLDPDSALDFLPKLQDSGNLGTLAVLHLDLAADEFTGGARNRFREKVVVVANDCKAKVRKAILQWLKETSGEGGREITALLIALSGWNVPRHAQSPARL